MKKRRKKAEGIRQRPLSSNNFFALRAEQIDGKTTIAVVVPARLFPKAVQRNRIRRQIRSQLLQGNMIPKTGWNIMISVRSHAPLQTTGLRRALFDVLKKSGIVFR